MKTVFSLVLVVLAAAVAHGRQNGYGLPCTANAGLQHSYKPYQVKDTPLTKAAYLKKSNTQRTVGWALLGGGVVMAVAGGVIFSENFEIFSNKNDSKAAAGGILFLTGAGCTLSSIPFFISASGNAKKAASIGLGTQRVTVPHQNNFTTALQPAFRFTVNF